MQACAVTCISLRLSIRLRNLVVRLVFMPDNPLAFLSVLIGEALVNVRTVTSNSAQNDTFCITHVCD